ncbi:hypothetical protein [Azospirillum rugosum]|uniref:Uncharacterized protein n=1 Tax=Azospirillum rugosum TaxID=416170 RepID=A0ABS4SJP0_9PROT|nr:hypothetical protein [Azospirillum rugosum]MBP2292788.1 hypothetical protein [Azospirillum rugosum]MDQ0527047.1 hypothetical protein [Azospirillum rugosum]
MTTTTFSPAGASHQPSTAIQAIGAFVTAWFKATPVYIVYSALAH